MLISLKLKAKKKNKLWCVIGTNLTLNFRSLCQCGVCCPTFSPGPTNMHVSQTVNSKVGVGVALSVNGYWSFCAALR